MNVYEYLQQDIRVKESKQYADISDMNMTESQMEKYSHSLHNLMEQRGEEFALKKILDVYRVNPLLAVKAMESCRLNSKAEEIVLGMKLLFDAVRRRNDLNNGGQLVVLNAMIPYTILLIEAAYQNSVSDVWDTKEVFLSYAKDQDYEAHQRKQKTRFLNGYNIRHLLKHIPENRQIELINWFWEKHCYAVRVHCKKQETYSGRRVSMMMDELTDSCLWKHLENMDSTEISERERENKGRERYQIQRFIENTIDEGMHLQYIKIILGEDHFDEKLRVLVNEDYAEKFYHALDIQRQREDKLLREEKVKKRMNRYNQLVHRVKEKYSDGFQGPLSWYEIGKKSDRDQLSLWNYWQGFNFEDVKIMVLGFDWGSLNDKNQEMETCIRKIRALKKGQKETKYYSCRYKQTDHSLEWLFEKCFARNLRDKHYTDLYFSTLCLGYRSASNVEVSDELVLSDVKDFMLEELRIIQPDVIFCLGPKVMQLFMDGMGEVCENIDDQSGQAHLFPVDEQTIRVYTLPHCGVAGIKEMKLEEQLKIWDMVREDMKENGIIL